LICKPIMLLLVLLCSLLQYRSTIPSRSLRRSAAFGVVAPSFTERDCSQDSTSLISAKFLLLRCPLGASRFHSLKTTKITCLSPSLRHSSHTLPSAPYQSLRSGLLLAPSFLRSAHNFCFQESIVTGAITRHSAYSPHTVSSWLSPVPPRVPARRHLRSAPPPFGPPGLGLPGPLSAPTPSPYKGTSSAFSSHRFSKLLPGSLFIAFQAYRKRATIRRGQPSRFSRHAVSWYPVAPNRAGFPPPLPAPLPPNPSPPAYPTIRYRI
jgi:hypothetical protein